MKISKLIAELQAVQDKSGDIDVLYRNLDPNAAENALMIEPVRVLPMIDTKDGTQLALIV